MRVALSAQVDWKVTALKAKASVSVRATLAGWLWEVLEECDGVLRIPMFGLKNSLNVATAGTVMIWEALRQWELEDRESP